MLPRWLVIIAPCFSLGLTACATMSYYAQAASGQMAVLRARQPITHLLNDQTTDDTLKRRLQLLADARDWAVGALRLPDNGSYRSYADLKRAYVVWNVFATPELSLAALQHCFPVAGCVAYQGWYHEQAARRQAQRLQARGYDVYVGGAPAYSTLGWFDDPVLSPMLRWDDATLIETLFHELAHQKLYVPDDTAFNESFAEFVGAEGLRAYRAQHPQLPSNAAQLQKQAQLTQMVLARREQLGALYAADLPEPLTRALKSETFAGLQQDYVHLRDDAWRGDTRYDAWFTGAPLNNARLLPFGLYDQNVPAFAALFERSGRDWPRFYEAAAALGKLSPAARTQALQRLREDPAPGP